MWIIQNLQLCLSGAEEIVCIGVCDYHITTRQLYTSCLNNCVLYLSESSPIPLVTSTAVFQSAISSIHLSFSIIGRAGLIQIMAVFMSNISC